MSDPAPTITQAGFPRTSSQPDSPAATLSGSLLIEWLNKHVEDKVVRIVLVGSVAVSVVAGALSSVWDGSLIRVLSSLAILTACACFLLLLRTLAVAVQTIPDGAEDGTDKRIKAAQTNARFSVVLLVCLGLVLYLLTSLWRMSWRDMEFGFHHALWSYKVSSLADVVKNVRPNGQFGTQLLPSEIMILDAEELSWLNKNSNILLDYEPALKLITKRELAEVSGPLNLNLSGNDEKRIAVVAAKEIVLKADAQIVYGSTNVLFLAHRLRFENGSQILAYLDDDIPVALHGKATKGEDAGTLRIIALAPYTSAGKARIDAFGQIGSDGPDGLDGAPHAPPTANLQGRKVESHRPRWAFRGYRLHEIERALSRIDARLRGSEGETAASGTTRNRLVEARRKLESCLPVPPAEESSSCLAVLCDESQADWSIVAKGEPGPDGRPGTKGQNGGESGRFGKVSMTLAGTPDGKAPLEWMDGTDVSQPPKPKRGALGGWSGRSGPGGPGKPGAAADPLEACVAGSQGDTGKQPEVQRERASSAPDRVGEKVTLQIVNPGP